MNAKKIRKLLNKYSRQQGQTVVAYLVFALLASAVIAGALSFSASNLRATYATKMRATRLYRVERDLGETIAWLRDNSQNMVSAYTSDQFYTHFLPGQPAVGSNDSLYSIPTQIKDAAGNNSIIITNSNELATGYFPETVNPESNETFNALTDFQSQAIESLVRITLINAIAVDASKDFGPPPASTPGTAFAPVYRIDVMSAVDQGMHLQSYVTTELASSGGGIGFTGSTSVVIKGAYCDAYDSSVGIYGGDNKKAECEINSLNNLVVQKDSAVYGSLNSKKHLKVDKKALHCANFESGCPQPGPSCEGDACSISGLPSFDSWNTLCPAQQSELEIEEDTTLYITGDDALDRCWEEVEVADGVTLTLASTDFGYYFEEFSLGKNAVVKIEPQEPGGAVSLFFDSLSPKKVTGAMFVNTTARPSQFELYYLDNAPLKLEGDTSMALFLTAPHTSVTTKGNFDFFGGIAAKNLHLEEGVRLHYDSAGGSGDPADMQLQIRDQAQTFR